MLYVVATPLGNLEDITRRAARILAEVDEIVAEDTRHSRRLLDAIGVRGQLSSYHDHSGDHVVAAIVERLRAGRSIALITDAGTPCISDPGYRLVRAAQDAGVKVVPIPGPSAVIAFLSAAGLATDRFRFVGFFARKDGERRDALRAMLASDDTVVGYESPQRLVSLLAVIAELAPDREVAIGRELTKMHEEIVRGTASSVASAFANRPIVKGEVVVGMAAAPATTTTDADVDAWVAELVPLGARSRDLARAIARRLGRRADDVYERILQFRSESVTDDAE